MVRREQRAIMGGARNQLEGGGVSQWIDTGNRSQTSPLGTINSTHMKWKIYKKRFEGNSLQIPFYYCESKGYIPL